MSTAEEINMEQSAIILKQQAEVAELKDSMKQMKEMMMLMMNQVKTPQNVPVPETPPPRGQSLRFATSTPYTGMAGMETTIGAGEDSLLGLAATSSETSQSRTKSEIRSGIIHQAGGEDSFFAQSWRTRRSSTVTIHDQRQED
jgi:hypothetical protein